MSFVERSNVIIYTVSFAYTLLHMILDDYKLAEYSCHDYYSTVIYSNIIHNTLSPLSPHSL